MKTFQKIKTVENEERYEQKLANKYGKDNISTIQKNDGLVVTEKIDGSNAQVRNHQGKLYVYSHHKQLDESNTLNGFYNFVMEHEKALLQLIPAGYSFFGEWLTPHHVKYPEKAYNKWYLFDMFKFGNDDTFTDTGEYLGINKLISAYVDTNVYNLGSSFEGYLNEFSVPGVYTVPIYSNLESTYKAPESIADLDTLRQALSSHSLLGAEGGKEEGIVVTDTSKIVSIDEQTKGPLRIKCVNEAFKEVQHAKKPLGAGEKAALEWANKYITEPRVRKQIYELQDNGVISKELSFDMFQDGTTSNIAKLVFGDAMEESEETPEALTIASPSYEKNNKRVLKFACKLVNKVIALSIKGM